MGRALACQPQATRLSPLAKAGQRRFARLYVRMHPMSRRSVFPFLAAMTAGCSPLGALNMVNRLLPGDGGVRRVATGAAFGPDERQRADVYAPERLKGSAPVLLFFYGGSWASGRRQDYGFAARALAAQGFVVVVPDYRLVPAVRFPAFVEDGAAAVAWTRAAIARHGGDANRLALVGHSAGAYIAMMLALDTGWLAAAGVDPGIVRAAVGLAGPYDFHPFDVDASRNAFGMAPDPQATQPVRFARADAPPVLLATGSDDITVKPRNSIGLVEALRREGAAAELKSYPGLDHADILLALSKPFRGKAPVLRDVTTFLARSLAPHRGKA